MAKVVLDTYALCSFLDLNPGKREIKAILKQAQSQVHTLYMSQINLGELAYLLEHTHGLGRAMDILSGIMDLPINREPATWTRILSAAHIKANHPMSYADAFAVGLAQELGASVVTGDPEFAQVEELISVTWLPKK